jgi:hypothetical protein
MAAEACKDPDLTQLKATQESLSAVIDEYARANFLDGNGHKKARTHKTPEVAEVLDTVTRRYEAINRIAHRTYSKVVSKLKRQKYIPTGSSFKPPKWTTDMQAFHVARNVARLRPTYSHQKWNAKKKRLRLKSWRKWAAGLIDQAVKAVESHDYAKEAQIYKALGRKHTSRRVQPTTHPVTQQPLTRTEDQLEQWAVHLEKQLAGPGPTDLETLPDRQDEILSRDTLERAARRATEFKMPGRDKTALEALLRIPELR